MNLFAPNIHLGKSLLFFAGIMFAASSTFAMAQEGSSTKKSASPAKSNSEFEVLFDGKSLDNFRGYHKAEISGGWKIEDGNLMFDASERGDIMTKKEYGNFDLRWEWKVSKGANSGVMYRVSVGDKAPYFTGPEYQILDDDVHKDGKKPITSAGSLYAMYVPENKQLKKVGEWNTARIVATGNRIEHWLNGQKVVQTEIGSEDWKKRYEASKFKTWKKFATNAKGHICFQDHGDKVWYRNIKIKNLDK